MTNRYKITVEYDGANFLGWQRQNAGDSVQAALEEAVEAFSQQKTEVFGAGRTDAGVHALGQIAHFDLETRLPPWRIRDALNAHLRDAEKAVAVLEVQIVEPHFHSRFSAKSRSYVYKILNRRAPSPILQNRAWWIPAPLDVEKMREAARFLLGSHDFTSFRAVICQAKSPVKTLDKFEIIQETEELVTCRVEARSFLHHQVRNMVGTLKLAGARALEPEAIKAILAARDRKAAGPTAPACGLYLEKIGY